MASVRQERILSWRDMGRGVGGWGSSSLAFPLGSALGGSWSCVRAADVGSRAGFGAVGSSLWVLAAVGLLRDSADRPLDASRRSTAAMTIDSFTRWMDTNASSIFTVMFVSVPLSFTLVESIGSVPAGAGSPSVTERLFERHVIPLSEAIFRAFLMMRLSL